MSSAFLTGELEAPQKRKHFPFVEVTWYDAPYKENAKQRAAFEKVRLAERQFAVQLRKIAKHIQDIVLMYEPGDPQQVDEMVEVLNRYAMTIRPWARAVSRRLLAEVARRDEMAWARYTKLLGLAIQHEIRETPVGHVMQALMAQQVDLITSIPLEAAQRVHQLAISALYEGGRASEIAAAIREQGEVSKGRANLIARTETSRASTTFTQARAQAIGSTHYIWRTSKDRRVRVTHRPMEGKVCEWANPPLVEPKRGLRYHAGCFPNCRCYVEPILPE